MGNQIDHRAIAAGMQQGRVLRAFAFQRMVRIGFRRLRDTAKVIVTLFS